MKGASSPSCGLRWQMTSKRCIRALITSSRQGSPSLSQTLSACGSPAKKVDLTMKNYEQICFLQQLCDDVILCENEHAWRTDLNFSVHLVTTIIIVVVLRILLHDVSSPQ